MIGRALKVIRSFYGISQSDLSSRLGISNSYLSEIESGKKQPTIELLSRYSELFEIPLSSILFFSENLGSARPTDRLRASFAEKIISILEWNQRRDEARKAVKSKEAF